MTHGTLIVLEGIDGSGKATQSTLLEKKLKEAGKYDDEEERMQFLSWLEKTEYEELELPRPDLVILLDIPLGMSEALVKARAAEGGSMDIHEQHLDYLRKCHDAYQALVRFYGWERIPCAREGVLRSVTDIGRDVDAAVEKVMKNRK